MARKPLRQQIASSLDEILYGYPRRGGRNGAPSLREIALATRKRWENGARNYTATGYFQPADLITPLRVLGMCSFKLDRLESLTRRSSRRRMELDRAATAVRALRGSRPRAYDRALTEWSMAAWENHRRQMGYYRRIATGRGFRGREPWQFVIQVLFAREAEDYTLRAALELGMTADAEALLGRYRELEGRNRDLIRRGATWYGRNAWRWIEPPTLFPDEHWWRGVIWETHRAKRRHAR